MLDPLEDRYLLATWLWVAGADGFLNVEENWRDIVQGTPGIPALNDSLLFNPNITIGGKQGSNKVCTYNGGGTQFAQIAFNAQSTAKLTLATAADTIWIAGSLNMNGGTIDGPAKVTMKDDTTFTFTGGRIDVPLDLGSQFFGTNVTTTISGAGEKRLGGFVANWGTVTWTDAGPIVMGAAGYLSNIGTFDIRGNGNINAAGVNAEILNQGVLKKTNGAGTTTIGPKFINQDYGQLLLQSGVVKFSGSAKQIRGSSDNAVTELNGGGLETTSTYYVGEGTLRGVGTITGNVATYDPDNTNLGGEVIPGLSNAPGTLNIVGNFTMGLNGILGINIDAAGNISLLRVQQNAGQGGNATLNGFLWVDRNQGYTPAVGTTRTFLEYVTVTNDFSHIEIYNNSWVHPNDPLAILLHFEAQKLAARYQLVAA